MSEIFDSPDAFEPFFETLIWQQRKSPKLSKTVRACVFHGRKEIEAYSSMQGVIKRYSDTWSVTMPVTETIAASMVMGDTLQRTEGAKELLTVQNVIKEDGEWIISVTSSQSMSVSV